LKLPCLGILPGLEVAVVLWAAILPAVMVGVMLLPIRLGAHFRYAGGHGHLWVVMAAAHLPQWQVRVPLHLVRLGKRGARMLAWAGVPPHTAGQEIAETVTAAKLAEEQKVPESALHMMLSALDVVQALLGADLSDERHRSLGSPVLHLLAAPFVLLSRHLCRLDYAWQTIAGTGDAVSTALFVGLLWSMKSSISALLEKRFTVLGTPLIHVEPSFAGSVFATDARCIFHFSIGQIMWRAVRDATRRWRGKGAEAFGR
jgi:hypothetical protein